MRKFTFFVFMMCSFVYAQNYTNKANRKSAERCLKVAENYLMTGDFSNAKSQAFLGITYDDSISDLYYVNAAVQAHENVPKAEILSTLNTAFIKDNWIGYSLNGARILYADLLCETKLYEESLEVLNEEPYIYSADAEIIRIKNLYRIGSEKSLAEARSKINTSRRIYPDDERFPNIFFLFEATFKNISELNNLEYEIPEIVSSITDAYINSFPNYKKQNYDSELLATFLVEGDVQKRLFNSIFAKEKNDSVLMAIAGKRAGVLSDWEALNMFLNTSNNHFPYTMLQLLMNYISEEEPKSILKQKLEEFDGTLLIDSDFSLQNDMSVKYDCGRPLYISYDKNCDGYEDLYAVCDLGSPLSVSYPNKKTEVFYEEYPYVQKINYLIDSCSYEFIKGDFVYNPFAILEDTQASEIGAIFYVPSVDSKIILPSGTEIFEKASKVSVMTSERKESSVVYHSSAGNLYYAEFFEGYKKYAFCNFEGGFPFERYIDYTGDGLYETVEVFDSLAETNLENSEMNISNSASLLDEKFIFEVFGNVFEDKKIYLKKIKVDRNGNTFYEFSEEYMENEGRINLWDYDDNGIVDNQFIKYPVVDGKIIEENIFFDDMGLLKVSVTSINDIPVKMNYYNEEVVIVPGYSENFYWIGNSLNVDELSLLEKVNPNMEQGNPVIIQHNEARFTVMKIGQNFYCTEVPEVTISLDSEILSSSSEE